MSVVNTLWNANDMFSLPNVNLVNWPVRTSQRKIGTSAIPMSASCTTQRPSVVLRIITTVASRITAATSTTNRVNTYIGTSLPKNTDTV